MSFKAQNIPEGFIQNITGVQPYPCRHFARYSVLRRYYPT